MLNGDLEKRSHRSNGNVESESLAKMRRQEEEDKIVNSLVASFNLDDADLQRVVELLSGEMEKGLNAKSHALADVKMFPTFVSGVPDGSEKGDFLAIDFGRSNFRIVWVNLSAKDGAVKNAAANIQSSSSPPPPPKPRVRSRIFVLSPPLMKGPGTDLFDFIAKCLASFMEKEDLLGRKLPLCFTFSFPIRQESLDRGRLVTWTKGFSCDGVEGEDVVLLFHDALARVGSDHPGIDGVKCVAIINDATGTLMSCAYAHSDCRVGVIFGTGSNACYVESASKVGTWAGGVVEPETEMIVDTVWGSFGENGCLDLVRTEFDRDNDAKSSKPGSNVYEKLIAGHYLGEIVRLALIKLHGEGILFKDSAAFGPSLLPPFPQVNVSPGMSRSPSSVSLGAEERSMETGEDSSPDNDESPLPKFLKPSKRRSFHTKYLTEVDNGDDLLIMKQVLGECHVRNPSTRECEIVKKICQAVSTRAANLSAAGLVALIGRISRPSITIGVDGSLFKFHMKFHDQLKTKVADLLSTRDILVKFVLADDGYAKGAALVAAVAEGRKSEKMNEQLEPMQL